jgi:hypothetical protein
MDKAGGPARCIRVLLHWNTPKGQRDIRHIYLRGTESLRTVGAPEREPGVSPGASSTFIPERSGGEKE